MTGDVCPEFDGVAGAALDVGAPRVQARGKFLFRGEEKLYVRGVTYGTFRADEHGAEFHDRAQVERDFAMMAAHGANAVRTYTVPPRWLLDAAARHGLLVMVGLPWEQHVAFLDDSARADSIVGRVADGVRACAGHEALLCFVLGNEIPAPIVRWHGPRAVARFIERLYRAAKRVDPDALVTYVNFPSTEYLELPFLDLACFNVYLESPDELERYLARLQNVAGDRPLLMAEIGLDSAGNGEFAQARALDWQVRSAFSSGCAGAFVFAWTDEWHRGGHDIEDWDFGLTDRQRRPKPALAAVGRAFADGPFQAGQLWPRISVVVCTYGGNATIGDCLEGLARLRYPDVEVIVVDDGSPDPSGALRANDYSFRLIQTENRGLSAARNTGWQVATGEIVAYLDDDAWPDPDWLTYLALAFARTDNAGIGGPNVPPADDGLVADCVANAPGGPMHVLISDTEAEHIPGCNMAFRRDALEAVGGFDPRFRAAGDDVDLCWRLQDAGHTLGFSPAAMVWHRRRDSIRAYWRQQRGYGRAEALLERKWPERYNRAGHLAWAGRIYGPGLTQPLGPGRWRVYHGIWGAGLFQRLYAEQPGGVAALPLMPEWYLVSLLLAGLTALGAFWSSLLLAAPLLALSLGVVVAQAGRSAAAAARPAARRSRRERIARWTLTTVLHVLQPLARLRGRLEQGLTPWRQRLIRTPAAPWPRELGLWCEHWRDQPERLAAVEAALREQGVAVVSGGAFDRWELEVRGGLLASARIRSTVEEHGAGRQLVRMRVWARWSRVAVGIVVVLAALAGAGAAGSAWIPATLFAVSALAAGAAALWEAAAAAGTLSGAVPAAALPAPEIAVPDAAGPATALAARTGALSA